MSEHRMNAQAFRRKLIKGELGVKPKGSHRSTEHDLQVCCMTWLRYEHPDIYKVTFAVPNGGLRDKATAAQMVAEGEKAGVSDIIVLIANCTYNALCIEMKTKTGQQSDKQKEWQEAVEKIGGSKYVICRSLEEFQAAITEYLND